MTPYRLYLDDIRIPTESGGYMYPVELRKEYRLHEWVIVKSYAEFVKCILERGLPTHISFDHDLADEHYTSVGTTAYNNDNNEKTGYHCAKWLCDYLSDNNLPLPICFVHSMNPIGKENIESLLNNFQRLSKLNIN